MIKVHIKICGIKRIGDALLAESLGASAVGFVFYKKSPRYIAPEKASGISEELGPFISRVGVFVDEDPAVVKKIVKTANLTSVQLHGSENNEYIKKLDGIKVIKALAVAEDFDCDKMQEYEVNTFLLDTFDKKGNYGGTGQTFNWNKAIDCNRYGRIILAGGIKASNVKEAVEIVRPWAIDVSSGVEESPGIKDTDKMNELFKELNT